MTGTGRAWAQGGRPVEALIKQAKALGIRHSRSAAALVDYSQSALTTGSEWDAEHEATTEAEATTLQLQPHDESFGYDDDEEGAAPCSTGQRAASPESADSLASLFDGPLSPRPSFQSPQGLGPEDLEFLQLRGLDSCTPLKGLGQGGYGLVDLVQVALPSGRTVVAARKAIHSPLYGQGRYERELRGLMLCAECPFVVDVYAARVSEDGQFSFLLEYCPNGSLHDMLAALEQRRRGKEKLLMPVQRLQYYAACILKGMEFIHAQGQAHRDIKPHNVLMSASGRPVLADTDAMDACDITKRAGTTSYQAPELWRASLQGAGYTTKLADMYSFGVTLVEMCAYPTLSGGNARLQAVKDDPAGSLPDYVPFALRDLCCGLLAPVAKRLDVAKALQHKFFEGLDWNDLQSGPAGFSVQLRPAP